MIGAGRLFTKHCGGTTRRELLQAGSLGVLGLSLADLLRMEATAAESGRQAKSVILLWLWGGPSHLDTFDLKPAAATEYRGPFSPIATSVPGIEICELLPQLAGRAHKYSIIRSMHHTSNDHGIAGTIGLTGSDEGAASLSGQVLRGETKPAHGAIVSRVLGFAPTMPRFVTLGGHLHQGHRPIRGEGGGTLGRLHDPFRLDYDPEQGVKIPQLELIDGLTRDGLTARRELLAAFDRLAGRLDTSATFEKLDQFYQQAFSLLTSSKSREIFDLDQEPDRLRRRYGRFRFGQCCLMARRLIEAGSRFVQVNWSSHVEPVEDTGDGGWDTHDRNFQLFQNRYAWMLDQSLSALLDDLDQRGLLTETLVVAVGEFGRTPKINSASGRDHWSSAGFAIMAGAGVPGGEVLGATDGEGGRPTRNEYFSDDIATTVYQKLGIPHDLIVRSPDGRPVQLLEGKPIREWM